MHEATTYLFNLFVVAKRVLNRGEKCARREEPAAATVAASVAAGVHESGSVSASWRHASAHAGSVGASMQAGRLVGCMHSRLLSWRRAQAFNARDGPTKPRTNETTAQRSNSYTANATPLIRVNGQSTDPTTTSVLTSSEGFGQGSGEN